MDLNKIFVDGGIYKANKINDGVFLCQAVEGNNIGKLTYYSELGKGCYTETKMTYFLNFFEIGDVKELFISRENYDMLGKLGINYQLEDNVLRGV